MAFGTAKSVLFIKVSSFQGVLIREVPLYTNLVLCVCRYCPECKTNAGEVIQAGEKMRLTKKKANMMSKKGTCQRDWGKVSHTHH